MNQGIYPKNGLSEKELEQIGCLEEICNRFEKLHLKLNWGMLRERPADEINDFLCYDKNEHLIAYLALYGFGGPTLEVSGMVHPEHRRKRIFIDLLKAASAECRRRKAEKLLLICQRVSESGKRFVEAVGARLEHSEYKMELQEIPRQEEQADELSGSGIRLREACQEDKHLLASIDSICFDEPLDTALNFFESELKNSKTVCYLAELGGSAIGAIKAHDEGSQTMIFGFSVLPEYRRLGYGREILKKTITRLIPQKPVKIALEVACENSRALALYKSCGFEETVVYDYYEMLPL